MLTALKTKELRSQAGSRHDVPGPAYNWGDTMPRRTRPRKLDPKHRTILEKLVQWLGNEMKIDVTQLALPKLHTKERCGFIHDGCEACRVVKAMLALANLHAKSHRGFSHVECKACGVAKAIMDCITSLAEQDSYELVEAIRKMREDLVSSKARLEEGITSLCSGHVQKAKEYAGSGIVVLLPGQLCTEGVPATSTAAPTIGEMRGSLRSTPFKVIFSKIAWN